MGVSVDTTPEGGVIMALMSSPEDRPDPLKIRDGWIGSQKSKITRDSYARDLKSFFTWADEVQRVHIWDISSEDLDAYRDDLLDFDLAPSTVARRLSSVSSFYDYAIKRRRVLSVNPMKNVTRPTVSSNSSTRGLTEDEAARFVQYVKDDPESNALVLLILGSGLRVSEAMSADLSDIEEIGGKHFLQIVRKGGKRQRVEITPAAVRALRAYTAKRTGPIFVGEGGRRMGRQGAYKRLRRAAEGAGIGSISPHVLRHTYATTALSHGAPLQDVQIAMGHSDPKTTMRYDRALRDVNNRASAVMAEIYK